MKKYHKVDLLPHLPLGEERILEELGLLDLYFSMEEVTEISIFIGTMNAEFYIHILQQCLLPS